MVEVFRFEKEGPDHQSGSPDRFAPVDWKIVESLVRIALLARLVQSQILILGFGDAIVLAVKLDLASRSLILRGRTAEFGLLVRDWS